MKVNCSYSEDNVMECKWRQKRPFHRSAADVLMTPAKALPCIMVPVSVASPDQNRSFVTLLEGVWCYEDSHGLDKVMFLSRADGHERLSPEEGQLIAVTPNRPVSHHHNDHLET